VHIRRQPVQCVAEHLQAAVDCTTQAAAATSQSPTVAAAWAWVLELLTLRPQQTLILAAYFLIWKPRAARKKAQQDYEH
jgi:hypothetical protein